MTQSLSWSTPFCPTNLFLLYKLFLFPSLSQVPETISPAGNHFIQGLETDPKQHSSLVPAGAHRTRSTRPGSEEMAWLPIPHLAVSFPSIIRSPCQCWGDSFLGRLLDLLSSQYGHTQTNSFPASPPQSPPSLSLSLSANWILEVAGGQACSIKTPRLRPLA